VKVDAGQSLLLLTRQLIAGESRLWPFLEELPEFFVYHGPADDYTYSLL
jgi:hypothetical protein